MQRSQCPIHNHCHIYLTNAVEDTVVFKFSLKFTLTVSFKMKGGIGLRRKYSLMIATYLTSICFVIVYKTNKKHIMKYQFYTNASKNNQLLYDVISENLFEIELIYTIRVEYWNFLILYGKYVLRYESFLTIFSLLTQQKEVAIIVKYFTT